MKNFVALTVAVAAFGFFGMQMAQRMSLQGEAPAPGAALARSAEPDLRGTTGKRTVRLNADSQGHYTVDARVEGQSMQMLVDTGASIIALTHEDARRINARPRAGDRPRRISTANGVVEAQSVRLTSVRIGSIEVQDVDAVIMPPGALSKNLLGMSFLRRIDSFSVDGNRLTMVD
jgi:aspartyl protease family protein